MKSRRPRRLVAKSLCDSYVLITNAGLSGTRAEEIKTLFKAAGVKHVAIFGSTWISQQIRENKRLRMLVPRVYGLGDLSQILDERAYAQARPSSNRSARTSPKSSLRTRTGEPSSARQAQFCAPLGEPAAGKTTIASLLAMAALDQWDASTLKLDEPGKVVERWNPDEPSQFFWLTTPSA